MRIRASTYAYLTIFWMITSAVMKPQHIVKKVSHVWTILATNFRELTARTA
jgi:hypothetical protein